MSELGEDISEVHEEVGVSFTILRDSGNISGEYCILKKNAQVTKPFTREFFMEGKFDWNTGLVAGDVVQVSDDRVFIVMNKTPAMYQDEAIEQLGVLYKCNVSGELQRISGENTYDDNYNAMASFAMVKDACYGLLTESLYGHDMETDEEMALLGLENHEFYVPHSMGVQKFDRLIPVSGENALMVEAIKTRRYDSVDVVTLSLDRR